MEEKQMMTNKELESQLQSLQTKDFIFKILTYGCCAGLVISLVMGKLAIFFVLMIITMVFGTQWSKASGAIKKLLSDNIISSVIKEALGDTVEYNPGGRVEPGYMVFPFSYNVATGSDHIKAVYKGLNIELSDIELINETEDYNFETQQTETSRQSVFKGQWLTCDFGKELAGEVYISEWTKKDRRSMKSNVAMDNEQFGKRFCVRADDPQEAYYILTPHMMEYITTMADKSGGIIYLSFLRNGKMHVAVKTGRDFFELGKSNANVGELRQKFLGELRWFTDIVDTLRVEDTLYKKATNV